MSNMSKELLREYIKEQNFTSPNEILNALKDMFRDVLQESLEAEMDEALGYGKYDSSSKSVDNSRNGWSYVNILDTKSQTFLCCTSS